MGNVVAPDVYIGKHRQDLTSGLYDVDICDARESLHEAKGGEKRILERNYLITGNIKGKEIIIIDDVLTTGQSVADYKEEIERCGGKVVAAIFYGKTFSMPSMLLVQIQVEPFEPLAVFYPVATRHEHDMVRSLFQLQSIHARFKELDSVYISLFELVDGTAESPLFIIEQRIVS